ncbi:MAG: 50S ribosomal protein L24 [Calditrichaeota bacterium]|nr:50S ribosomal protein L24 [Actinomycetota bacterium]NOY59759.1 50S ribosomal protein L24 [Calditrichota bacterium]
MRVRRNDQVLVLAGNYKGKKGKVLKVFPEEDRVIVEGVNFIKKHSRPTQQNPQGGIVEKEAPIHVANIMVICPKCNTPSRMGTVVVFDEAQQRKNRVRICKRCGEMLVSSN